MTPPNPPPAPGSARKTVDAHGDVYVISFPKCGRTWLRVLMAKAVSDAHAIPMTVARDLDLTAFSAADPRVPRIVFWHDDRVGLRSPGQLSTDKGFYRDRKVVFLLRDIRDTTVSHYFQRTRRESDRYVGTLGRFLTEEVGSVRTCLAFWNIWYAEQHIPTSFLLTSYERLSADTTGELGRILRFCGLPQAADAAVLSRAVEFAGFDAMRSMEATDALGTDKLRPTAAHDTESYKTRRGIVGGFRDYLSPKQIALVDEMVHDLLVPPWWSSAFAADGPPGEPLPHPDGRAPKTLP